MLAGLLQVDEDRCLVVMGDNVFEADDVRRLMAAPGRNVLAVDRDPQRQVGGLGGVPLVRVRMLDHGFEMTTCDFTGLWAAVETPDGVGALERVMWHRYGPKPTDQIIARTVNRRISGP